MLPKGCRLLKMVNIQTSMYCDQCSVKKRDSRLDRSGHNRPASDISHGIPIAWPLWRAHKGQSAASGRNLPHGYFLHVLGNTANHRSVAQVVWVCGACLRSASWGMQTSRAGRSTGSLWTDVLVPPHTKQNSMGFPIECVLNIERGSAKQITLATF